MYKNFNLECDGVTIEQETKIGPIVITVKNGGAVVRTFEIGTKMETDEGNCATFDVPDLKEIQNKN